MAKEFSGFTQVEYADTVGGSKTAFSGKISSDSTVEVPNTVNETTTGQIWGGGQVTAEVMFFDFADYSTVEGWMTGDTEKSFTFTFDDGRTLETQELVQPFAERGINPNARDGVAVWTLSFEEYRSSVLLS